MSEIEYKVIMLGKEGSGKTSFFKKLTTGIFPKKTISTLGLDRKTINQKLEINNKGKIQERDFIIKLYDTQGIERFKTMPKSYFKGSDGILLVYDITNRESFDSIQMLIDSVESELIVLIGNKSDLVDEDQNLRTVTEDEAKEFCDKNEIFWGGEISVKTIAFEELKVLFGEYIKKIYEKVGDVIIKQYSPKLLLERPSHRKNQLLC